MNDGKFSWYSRFFFRNLGFCQWGHCSNRTDSLSDFQFIQSFVESSGSILMPYWRLLLLLLLLLLLFYSPRLFHTSLNRRFSLKFELQEFSAGLFQAFGDHSKRANYNWHHRHSYVPQLFYLSGKIQIFFHFFSFLSFLLYGPLERPNPLDDKLLSFWLWSSDQY